MSLSHGDINLNLLEAFIDNCSEALDFLENKTDAKFSILEGYPDYYLDRPGAIKGGGRALDNNLFDYSKVEYKNARENVIIICKYHGEFLQKPNDHLSGSMF